MLLFLFCDHMAGFFQLFCPESSPSQKDSKSYPWLSYQSWYMMSGEASAWCSLTSSKMHWRLSRQQFCLLIFWKTHTHTHTLFQTPKISQTCFKVSVQAALRLDSQCISAQRSKALLFCGSCDPLHFLLSPSSLQIDSWLPPMWNFRRLCYSPSRKDGMTRSFLCERCLWLLEMTSTYLFDFCCMLLHTTATSKYVWCILACSIASGPQSGTIAGLCPRSELVLINWQFDSQHHTFFWGTQNGIGQMSHRTCNPIEGGWTQALTFLVMSFWHLLASWSFGS